MVKALELSYQDFVNIKNYCRDINISFLSTPDEEESLKFLVEDLELDIIKIGSGEINNYPFLKKIGAYNKSVIISTGMCNLSDIEQALDILVKNGTSKDKITVLHCNTEYPTPIEHVNLSAMNTIREAFKVNVGYSDHTLGINVPVAATVL